MVLSFLIPSTVLGYLGIWNLHYIDTTLNIVFSVSNSICLAQNVTKTLCKPKII